MPSKPKQKKRKLKCTKKATQHESLQQYLRSKLIADQEETFFSFQHTQIDQIDTKKQKLEPFNNYNRFNGSDRSCNQFQGLNIEYNFHYLQNDPSSLTMTIPPTQLVKMLYTFPTYILLQEKDSFFSKQQILQIKQQLKCELLCFQSVEKVKRWLMQQRNQNVYILCAFKSVMDMEKAFGKEDQIKKIFCFSEPEKFQNLKKRKEIGLKFSRGTESLDELLQHLAKSKTSFGYQKNEYMNFINLKDEAGKSNVLTKIIYGMVNQRTNKKMLIEEMIELAKLIGFSNKEDFQEFKKEFVSEGVDQEKIIKWYTKQSFVYDLVNSLLRFGKHPAQMYSIQPYFRLLFASVKELHQRCGKFKTFTCYRGGVASEKQLQCLRRNVGCVVQNLGFMSASLKRQVAEEFAKNVMFIVRVKESFEENFGFADISDLSCYGSQAQILFNPLNFFQIVSKQEKQINGKNITVFKMLFSPPGRNFQSLKTYQQFSDPIQNFGDVLVQENQIMKGCQKYWQKHRQLCNKEEHIAKNEEKTGIMYLILGKFTKALEFLKQRENKIFLDQEERIRTNHNLGIAYQNLGQFSKALQYFEKCEDITKTTYGTQHPGYAAIINSIGMIHQIVGQQKRSLEFYNESLRILKDTIGDQNPLYANTLGSMGRVYQVIGQYDKSLQHFTKCEKIYRNSLGIEHPLYAMTLNDVGNIYQRMGKYNKSLLYLKKCQQINKRTLRPNHPQLAITLSNIAMVYQLMGQLDYSLQLYFKCLEIYSEQFGLQHPDCVTILSCIGLVYESKGQLQKSLQYFNSSSQLCQKSLESEHPLYACIIIRIGLIYRKIGSKDKSLQFFTKFKLMNQAILQGLSELQGSESGFSMVMDEIEQVFPNFQQFRKSREQLKNRNGKWIKQLQIQKLATMIRNFASKNQMPLLGEQLDQCIQWAYEMEEEYFQLKKVKKIDNV